ncbi:hypothetical protein BC567DRAFT_214394 [Phyllosticta citribraziliensis]
MNMDVDVENAAGDAGSPVRMEPQRATDAFQHTNLRGYPALANDLCEPEYMSFRTFKHLRMRMLLWQQFHIATLEKKLQSLDQEDNKQHPKWLISQAADKNEARKELFEHLKVALAEYDDLLARTKSALSEPKPTPYRVECAERAVAKLAKAERDYLKKDLLDIGGTSDPRIGKILRFTEKVVRSMLRLELFTREKCFGEKDIQETSMKTSNFLALARAIAALLSVVILLLPILVLNFVQSSGMRLLVVFISAAVFISTLTVLTPAGTSDVFVAGATYCAVLVVFVSQTDGSG